MEKRYQVFVSSTFEDLKEQRQEVIQALLELDCIPSGMELFPAADDAQWEIIRQIIDSCDYYLLILGGRYGSMHKDGISYTEKEFDYAIAKGKPTISFVHGDPGKIASDNVEKSAKGKTLLRKFRAKVEKKMCKRWLTTTELGSAVKVSLPKLIKQKPGIGWIRADQVASGSMVTKHSTVSDFFTGTTWAFLGVKHQKINRFHFGDDSKVTCVKTYKNASWTQIDDNALLFGYGVESSYIAFKFTDANRTKMEGRHMNGAVRYLEKIK